VIEQGELVNFEPMMGLSRFISVDELKNIKFSTLKNRIYIKDKKITDWKKDIEAIARHQNVYCKISGMVTETDWKQWKR
jgi:hypothetical protein